MHASAVACCASADDVAVSCFSRLTEAEEKRMNDRRGAEELEVEFEFAHRCMWQCELEC